MLTEKQISFAVEYWAERLHQTRTISGDWRASDNQIKKFKKALAKELRENQPDTRCLACHHGPHSVLFEALEVVNLIVEPPVLVVDVDMVFNPDGSIHLREGGTKFVRLEP